MKSKLAFGGVATVIVICAVAFLHIKDGAPPQQALLESKPLASSVASNEIDIRATPASTPFRGNNAVADIAWKNALKGARRDSLQTTAQRAAVTGKISDLIALRVAERACQGFRAGVGFYTQQGLTLSQEQLEYFATRRDKCDFAGVPNSSRIKMKDSEGLGVSADALLLSIGGSFDEKDPRRREVVQSVMESGSIELLDAIPRTVFGVDDAYAAGLSRGTSALVDELLLDTAIKVRACAARSDCEVVALDRLDCSRFHSCVGNMQEYPDQKIFVDPGSRAWPLQNSTLSTQELRARWDAIQAFLANRFGQRG